jgi:hypothetical protein
MESAYDSEVLLTFRSAVVTICTTSFNIKLLRILSTPYIYVLVHCMILTIFPYTDLIG